MLFSLVGEIGLIVIGLLYVGDCFLDSFINLMETVSKNNSKDDDQKELPESIKHLYS